ncbi:MAG: ribosome biogenesis factor YjgA [Moraxella sp.]|nr:ribosome biogenesis factor YjgA [Moraxella sp.]
MNIDFNTLDMRVSRTELKKSHERLQALATPLVAVPKKKWASLPVSEYFLDELNQLAKITSAAAKNRQIKRIGKLIVEEDRHALTSALFELKFDAAQRAKIEPWLTRLNLQDDSTLKQFVKQFNASEYNSIYQLLLWIEYARHQGDEELLAESEQDLVSYIKEVAILST